MHSVQPRLPWFYFRSDFVLFCFNFPFVVSHFNHLHALGIKRLVRKFPLHTSHGPERGDATPPVYAPRTMCVFY